jgi:hypothetical protein
MSARTPPARQSTYTVSDKTGEWKVYRGASALRGFHTRGDAVRAACFSARDEDKRGGRARVLAAPGDEIIPHYEPYFGL